MSEPAAPITIAFRIPGPWSHPRELIERLPAECQLTPDTLTLADGTKIEFGAAAADGQFADVFRTSCRRPPTKDEQRTVAGYKVNVFLMGPGGSVAAAQKMMDAGAAVVRAGGAGVFIDNSALAHGGQDWLELTEAREPDAVSFAFVSIVATEDEVYTMGMHALGLREIVMKRVDADAGFDPVEVIRYMAAGDKPVREGHIFADLEGPRFQTKGEESPKELAGSPMHNPFGRFRLIAVRDINQHN